MVHHNNVPMNLLIFLQASIDVCTFAPLIDCLTFKKLKNMEFFNNKLEKGECVITKKVLGYDSQEKYIQNLMIARGCSENYDILCSPFCEFEKRTSEGTETGVEWVSVEEIKEAYNKSISEGKDYFVLMVSLEKDPAAKRVPDHTMDIVKSIAANSSTLEMVICTDGIIYDGKGAFQRTDIDFYYIFSYNKKVESIRFAYVSSYYENELIDKVAIKNWGEVRDVCSETVLGYGRVVDVKYSDLKENGMILNHHFHFIQEQELQNVFEGCKWVSLKDLFFVSNRKYGSIKIDDSIKYASKNYFSEKTGEVLNFTPFDVKVLDESETIQDENLYAYQIPANSLVLNSYGSRCSFLWNSADVPMALVGALKKGCRVITYTSDIVDGAYMTKLIMEGAMSYKVTALSMLIRVLLGWEDRMTLSEALNLKIVVPSVADQKTEVQVALENYKKQVLQEQEAERKRLGIYAARQDIQHMLKSPQNYQETLLELLEPYASKDGELAELIADLIDNTQFIMRLIDSFGANYGSEEMVMSKECINISEIIENYCTSRRRYYDSCFTLESRIDDKDVYANVDRTFLLVMMDTIIENAYRHAFRKCGIPEKQKVLVSVSNEIYNDVDSVHIRVANNGREMSISFEDFISRGHYDKESGHTGLGGNHIYDIIKRHNGLLLFSSDQQWSVIFDIYIPLNN